MIDLSREHQIFHFRMVPLCFFSMGAFGMAHQDTNDPLYDRAVEIVISTRRASISAVQRQGMVDCHHPHDTSCAHQHSPSLARTPHVPQIPHAKPSPAEQGDPSQMPPYSSRVAWCVPWKPYAKFVFVTLA